MNARLQIIEADLHAAWREALAGNARCYQDVLTRLSQHLRLFLRRRLRDKPQDVEDLVQEILLSIHQKRHTYDPKQPLTAWIYAIARYKLIDHLRAQARHDDKNDPIDDWHDQLWMASTEDANASKVHLTHMLSQLPDKQRRPIEHTKLEGHTVAEAAELTGQSESAVKVNIHRGLKALAKLYGGIF
jgi:RNA polymerase sigma-70 factor (ECF subfamily)